MKGRNTHTAKSQEKTQAKQSNPKKPQKPWKKGGIGLPRVRAGRTQEGHREKGGRKNKQYRNYKKPTTT